MNTQELKKLKAPAVIIDKSLERFKGKNLFPEKLAKAKDVANRLGLPKIGKL